MNYFILHLHIPHQQHHHRSRLCFFLSTISLAAEALPWIVNIFDEKKGRKTERKGKNGKDKPISRFMKCKPIIRFSVKFDSFVFRFFVAFQNLKFKKNCVQSQSKCIIIYHYAWFLLISPFSPFYAISYWIKRHEKRIKRMGSKKLQFFRYFGVLWCLCCNVEGELIFSRRKVDSRNHQIKF